MVRLPPRRSPPDRRKAVAPDEVRLDPIPREPIGELHPQPWMTAPETRAVLDALTADGAEARFIGGCVRDALLKRPIRDIDIAIPEPPETAMALLERAGIRVVPTGFDHGTVTAVIGKSPFEITSLRVDVETYGRHAKVAYTDDWIADAARRDFTINALSCTPDGHVYDYFHGIDDLGHGRIRFVGAAGDRIAEDALRLLRFFRFYANYGQPPPDADALAACRAKAADVQVLSGERVRVEIFRTLMATDPADVFVLMQGERVLEHVLPEAGNISRLRMMSWLDTRAIRMDSVAAHPVRRLAALLSTDAGGANAVADRFKMSNRQRRRLEAMAEPPAAVTPDMSEGALRHAFHRFGPQAVRDLALLGWADELSLRPHQGSERTQKWVRLIEAADAWSPLEFPLKGRDALALGVPHGPAVGELMDAVESWWEDNDYRPDRDACLARLRELTSARMGV